MNDDRAATSAADGESAEHGVTGEPGVSGEDPAFGARVLRSFIRDGRLVSIPARERRRLVVYRYLRDQIFTEDRAYPEPELNQRLALFHPDVATIRRGMVDAGLVTRSAGQYRRTG